MDVVEICVLISSLSFFGYAISYFISPHMKQEFIRYGLQKFSLLTILLEIAGAIGLIVGLVFNPILIVSSLGLALLMLSGFIVRVKIKDSIWVSLPALFFMGLNAYIFWESIN
ncbi:MAG: DoxX family protein [Rubritalea sp.]